MVEKITPDDISKIVSLSSPSISPKKDAIAISVHRADIENNEYKSDIWLIGISSKIATRFTYSEKDYNPLWSPSGLYIAFLSRRGMTKEDKGNQLYIIRADGGEGKKLIERKEGIDSFTWSPDSRKIAFISQVTREKDDDVKVIERIGFWFNGRGWIFNKRQHLFLLDVESTELKQLTEGDLDVKFARFSNKGDKIAYVAATDDSKPFITDIFVLDLINYEKRKLTNSDMSISSLTWSPDDSYIAFIGNRLPRGFASHNKVWAIRPDTGIGPVQIENLDRNKSNSLNSDVRSFSTTGGNIRWIGEYIYFPVADGPSVNLYKVSLKSSPELVLGGKISLEGFDIQEETIAYAAMDATHPMELYVYDGQITKLTSFNDKFVSEYSIIEPTPFRFRASDNVEIDGWLLKPQNNQNKYPAIVYIHGGPKTCFGDAFLFEFQFFANSGYAVIYMNPRGSDGYTEDFADIRKNYGKRDYQDLMEGLDHVIQNFDFIDHNRIGVAGGSYGGFMTNWIIGHTNRFKAAVTDRSIANWVTFFCTSDIGREFTLDQIGSDPWNDPENLFEQSPIKYLKNVETPTLIIHSQEDYRCWLVEGLQMYTSLKYLGKTTKLVIFPGENHDLSRFGKPKNRIIRLKQYLDWFDAHLK